jgi:hypothetical protein
VYSGGTPWTCVHEAWLRKEAPSDQVDRVGGLVMVTAEADAAHPSEQSLRNAGMPSTWLVPHLKDGPQPQGELGEEIG